MSIDPPLFPDGLLFEQINTPEDPRFEAVTRIYLDSFPDDERKPLSLIRRQLMNGQSRLWIASEKEEVLLMAILWPLQSGTFVLLEYMAVAENARNRNIGGRFLAFLLDRFKQRQQYLLLEIEHPGHGENNEQRSKRLGFYLRNGAYLLQDVPYKLPSFGCIEPMDMLLLIAPYYPEGIIAGSIIQSAIRDIYTEIYAKTADNADLATFIGHIPEHVKLIQ